MSAEIKCTKVISASIPHLIQVNRPILDFVCTFSSKLSNLLTFGETLRKRTQIILNMIPIRFIMCMRCRTTRLTC